MQQLVATFRTTKKATQKHDDDFIDRLNHRFTVTLLVVATIVVSMQQYVGKPVTCWAPKHFTGSHTKFTNSYCWVKDTYYLEWDKVVPRAEEHDKRQLIRYYQWVPFILLAQALLFYLPSLFWHAFNSKSGVDADDILATAHSMTATGKVEQKSRILALITNQIHRFLDLYDNEDRKEPGCHCDFKHIMSATCCRLCSKTFGNYLVLLYSASKLLFIANIIGQLFVLNNVLGARFNLLGIDILRYMSNNQDWTEAAFVAFPRVTMCDFNVRRLGNIHRYTVQCVLPINLYTEKIYIFLWFWFVFVAFMNALGAAVWFIRFALRSDRLSFVQNHLIQRGTIVSDHDYALTERFLDKYLRQDGVFVLRLIAANTNNIAVTDIIVKLWEDWRAKLPVWGGAELYPEKPTVDETKALLKGDDTNKESVV